MRDVNLAAYQPNYYQKSAFMKALNGAIESEFALLFESREELFRELHIETAEKLLYLWERSVGLTENPPLTLAERRSRVLARFRQLDATTPARVKAIAESYARGEVEIVEDFANYTVIVKFVNRIGKPDNMEGLIKQLRAIMPAHLVVDFVYPYRTWRDVLESGLTWGEILEAGHSWEDLMNKEEL